MTAILSSLPRPVPPRIARLPVSDRGYPVPFFVQWFDDAGKPTRRGVGKPDFRVADGRVVTAGIRDQLCWICGERVGSHKTFTIGPMCAINRISSEPPSHLDCADWSARACPFLTNPAEKWRENRVPEGVVEPAGHMIRRNPGIAMVWTTRKYKLVRDGDSGVLFRIGDPVDVRFYAEGVKATRAQVLASIDSGLHLLLEGAPEDDREAAAGIADLKARYSEALKLLPEA